MFVLKEENLKFRTTNGLFKILLNLCMLLLEDEHFDNCYCNLSRYQCWMCNLADFVRRNKIKNDIIKYKKKENELIEIAYRILFYIKKIKKEKISYDDRKWILSFFKKTAVNFKQ